MDWSQDTVILIRYNFAHFVAWRYIGQDLRIMKGAYKFTEIWIFLWHLITITWLNTVVNPKSSLSYSGWNSVLMKMHVHIRRKSVTNFCLISDSIYPTRISKTSFYIVCFCDIFFKMHMIIEYRHRDNFSRNIKWNISIIFGKIP